VLVSTGIVTCHWPPPICGAGDVTFTQLPDVRLVRDCTVKPADASGHVNVKLVGIAARLMAGALVLNA
jgi:hypothetical protein